MVILSLRCTWCLKLVEVRSDQRLPPACPSCGRKLKPAGAVRVANEFDREAAPARQPTADDEILDLIAPPEVTTE